jgi:hypothetical protein
VATPITSPDVSVARAYWNQRSVIVDFLPRAAQLEQAVDFADNLTAFQWMQLFAMAMEFQPDLILDLGRDRGNSACVFTEAANRLKSCSVISLDTNDAWEQETLPKLQEFLPPTWFRPLEALRADILTFDYRKAFENKERVLVFWDAHGFTVAECVLGAILPLLENKRHLVMMHDLSDARYSSEDCTAPYGNQRLWKGENAEETRVLLGHISSAVAQSVAIVDFTSRNKLTLRSADHDLHAGLDAGQRAELQRLIGDRFFSMQGHWFWFSLNEKEGPFYFPRFEPPQQPVTAPPISLISRLKMGARIALNRFKPDQIKHLEY